MSGQISKLQAMNYCRNMLIASMLLCIKLAGCVYPAPEYNKMSIEEVPMQTVRAITSECQAGETVEDIVEKRFQNRPISFRATLYSKSSHRRRQVYYNVAKAQLMKLTECKIKSGVWHERGAQGHEICDAP